jgi:hypothetical protein
MRLAARIGAFGSLSVSDLVEEFLQTAYDLDRSLDPLASSLSPDEEDEEIRDLARRYLESSKNFWSRVDEIDETQAMLRDAVPSDDERLTSWAERNKWDLEGLEQWKQDLETDPYAGRTLLTDLPWTRSDWRGDDQLSIEAKRERLKETTYWQEARCSALADAAHHAQTILRSVLDETEYREWMTYLFEPAAKRARLRRKFNTFFDEDVLWIEAQRDRLRSLMRRIRERVQDELARPWAEGGPAHEEHLSAGRPHGASPESEPR